MVDAESRDVPSRSTPEQIRAAQVLVVLAEDEGREPGEWTMYVANVVSTGR